MRAAREIVRRYTTKSDYDKKNARWSCEAQRKAVVTTLAAYDFAGGIAKAALDEGNDLYLRVFRLCWGRSIKGVAETCSDFIDDMQEKEEGKDYYAPFLWLARECGYSAEKQSDHEKSRIGMIPPLIRLKVD